MYLGDFRVNSVVYLEFNTNDSDGASITIATDGTLRIYRDDSTTERSSANGITFTEDHDSSTGVHKIKIDLADNTDSGFYATAHEYFIRRVGMTIDGQTVNHCIAQFSIENRSALMPTTAGRTLLVESDGMAHADAREWLGGTIATPTQTGVPEVDLTHWLGTAAATPTIAGVPEVDLTHVAGSTTNVSTMPTSIADILVDTGTTLDARIPAALVSGRMDCSVGAMAANVITAAATAADFVTEMGVAPWESALDVTPVAGSMSEAFQSHFDDQTDIYDLTNEMHGDLADGGRLDLIFDGIKAKSDQLTFTTANKLDVTLNAATDVAAAVANRIADHVLRRNSANARASAYGDTVAFRSLLGATSKLTNKIAVSGSNLLIYEENDSTTFGTQAITSDASADPMTALDTA